MIKPLIVAFFVVSVASAADLTGIWTGVMTDRNGDLQDLSFRFTQTGSGLAGKMYGDNESIPLTDGKVEGNQISFVVTTELNGSISRMMYLGTLEGGEIHVTRVKAEAAPIHTTSTHPPEKQAAEKPNAKQSFTLRRL